MKEGNRTKYYQRMSGCLGLTELGVVFLFYFYYLPFIKSTTTKPLY